MDLSKTKILQDGCVTKRVPPAPARASSSSLRYSSSSSSSVILDAWRPLKSRELITTPLQDKQIMKAGNLLTKKFKTFHNGKMQQQVKLI